MKRVLGSCEDQPAFAKVVAWPEPGAGDNVTVATEQSAKSSGRKAAGSGSAGAGSVHFKNCTAARDAGAAPVRRGDAGYASHLDRDGDGVGCE